MPSLLPRHLVNHNEGSVGTRYAAIDENQISLRIHLHDLQTLLGHRGVTHVAGLLDALKNPLGTRRTAGQRTPVSHVTVGHVLTLEVVALHAAGETSAL